MNRVSKAAIATAATVTLTGATLAATAGTASANNGGQWVDCKTKRTEERVDPATGKTEKAQISEPCTIVGSPASGTGGLIFRDKSGNDTGSGMGEKDQFSYVHNGPEGSGLIYVKQNTSGQGGWGDKYEGYVKRQFTDSPNAFK